MTDPTLTQHARDALHERVAWTLSQREARDAAMARLDCPECGSMNGMAAIDREWVDADVGPYYRRPEGNDHEVCVPCPRCNPRRRIPAGYYPVGAAWVRAWLAAPCHCPDCERERMDNHAPADGNGKRGAERMYR